MACSKVTQAIQWIQSGSANEIHPVTAYLSKHLGYEVQFAAH
jgi:hypothetical protein